MEKVITSKPSSLINFTDIWKYRELLYFLILRDISVRYKQTLAGFFWLLIQPILTVLIFTFVFGQITKIAVSGVPYPVFVFSGLLFWNLFSRSIITASESIVSNQNLVKKIAFPRIILPLASIGVHIVDFFFSFIIFIFLLIIFRYQPNPVGLLTIPLVLLISLISAVGLGCFFASINVKYRDVRLLLPFLIQLLFFLTPVIYPLKSIDQKYQLILLLNPLAGIIEFYKSLLFKSDTLDIKVLLSSIILAVFIFLIGVYKFQRSEKSFADIV